MCTLQHLSSWHHIITELHLPVHSYLILSVAVPCRLVKEGEGEMHSAVDDIIKRTHFGGSVNPRETFCTSKYIWQNSHLLEKPSHLTHTFGDQSRAVYKVTRRMPRSTLSLIYILI
jgi:hypothetical protein